MKARGLIVAAFITAALTWIISPGMCAADSTPPASVVKLIFIHHSTGGNWLADPNEEQPYGGLGSALMNNNYFVSATNYGWGPDGIGDRTDIPNWPEWFTGLNSTTILTALYAENNQNIDGFGSWSRLATDPGGENQIIMFKSCFPNSDLFGDPDDPAGTEPNDQYTVSNAKAVYNNLLTYFQTRQDKLFVVITAPPQTQNAYGEDYQTPEHRAANARAFNNWLVNDWLSGYPYQNVCVFDYFNVLTAQDNHHRYYNGAIQHVTNTAYNFSAYPTDEWDSHPNTEGQQKATEEFVPLLNYYYNLFAGGSPSNPVPDIKANGQDGTLVVTQSDPVSITVSMNPGGLAGQTADWWIAVHTPLASPADWYSYVYPTGWQPGIHMCIQYPLFTLSPLALPQMSFVSGDYTFYFAVVPPGGNPLGPWLGMDWVNVHVQ
ncbi:MAG: hypothetical protein K9N21_20750 [Deltaproteobacteria bacterium]|nr:hypothetical protein [Deltaproteobacteria bacterium]